MNMSITAEDLYAEMERMPSSERTRFFLLLASKVFHEEDYTHDQVFGAVHREPFSVPEAAEYLEVSVPTLRRYVQSGKLRPTQIIGRSQLFDASDLRTLKRSKEVAGRC
ncbi:MAG: helix-turn-helix domain-containing protein [Desulfuromusa sp.]|jgi:excisionase family DNA binding protein|nr:helix-turn-helix domain-containing protein [Desulfuromusa sp.]